METDRAMQSQLTAEYQGQGAWLVTVQGEYLWTPPWVRDGDRFEEQWWVFESGNTPPTRKLP